MHGLGSPLGTKEAQPGSEVYELLFLFFSRSGGRSRKQRFFQLDLKIKINQINLNKSSTETEGFV